MDVSIDMKGMEDLLHRFEAMGERGDNAMRKALVETAIAGVTEMKAPANMPVVTGRLRSSIHYEKPETATYNYVDKTGQLFIGDFAEKPVGLSVATGTNVEYAEDVNEFSNKGKGFFKKGYDKMQGELLVRMEKNMETLMNEKH